jgi:Leucine-rich repeat (LRR) protein
MSDMYAFDIISVKGTKVEINVTQVHPDAGGFSATKNFALQMFYGSLHSWDNTAPKGGSLDQEFTQDDFFNDDFLRSVCHDYIASVKISKKTKDSAHYSIEATDEKWVAHLAAGMSWSNADYNRGPDLPPKKKSKQSLIGPKETKVNWPEKGLRKLDGEVVANATELRSLNLTKNFLASLPKDFGNLQNLEELNLEGNVLRSLPESFGSLSALKTLWLKGNQLETLPESFGDLKKLEVLELAETGDSMPAHFPESFSELSALRVLVAKGSGFKRFPQNFRRLQNLEELYLCNCAGEYLIEGLYEICHLPKLKIFEAFALNTLPREFGNLTKLERFSGNSCSLHKLPDTFSKLSEMKELELNSNEFREFPVALRSLKKLTKLNLNSNSQLRSLPDWIGELSQLEELHLSYCSLDSLPAGLANLSKLRVLSLDSNKLSSLSFGIEKLAKLEDLRLYNNSLTELPEGLEKLKKLSRLSLQQNHLDEKKVDALRKKLPQAKIQTSW